jgi:hypothetical protein
VSSNASLIFPPKSDAPFLESLRASSRLGACSECRMDIQSSKTRACALTGMSQICPQRRRRIFECQSIQNPKDIFVNFKINAVRSWLRIGVPDVDRTLRFEIGFSIAAGAPTIQTSDARLVIGTQSLNLADWAYGCPKTLCRYCSTGMSRNPSSNGICRYPAGGFQ